MWTGSTGTASVRVSFSGTLLNYTQLLSLSRARVTPNMINNSEAFDRPSLLANHNEGLRMT